VGYFLLTLFDSCSSVKYKNYLSILASFSSLFIALVFILEYCQLQKSDRAEKILPFADERRHYWSELETQFANNPELNDLYAEIHSNHPDLATAITTQNVKMFKEIQTVSLMLGQMENVFILHGGLDGMRRDPDNTRRQQQLKVWMRFFKSPKFRYHYHYLKENLGRDTVQFVQNYILDKYEGSLRWGCVK